MVIKIRKIEYSGKALILLFCIVTVLGLIIAKPLLYLAVLIAVLNICFSSEEQNYYFCLFLIPCIRILDGTGIKFFVNILLVLPLIIYFLRQFRLNSKAVLFTVVMFTYEYLHNFYYWNIGSLISDSAAMILLLYCWSITTDSKVGLKKEKVAWFLAFGVLFSSVSYILVNPNYIRTVFSSSMRESMRFIAYAQDPNAYSLYACTAIALLLQTAVNKPVYYLAIFALVFGVFLTASKMGFLIVVFMFLYYAIISYINSNTEKKKFIRRVLLAGLLLVVIFSKYVSVMIDYIMIRMGVENGQLPTLEKLTSGRSNIQLSYLQAVLDEPSILLFGRGINYNSNIGIFNVAHNTYLDVVLSWGFFGVILILLILGIWTKQTREVFSTEKGISAYFPGFILALTFMSLSCLSASMFWIMISVSILSLRKERVNDEDE